MKLPRNLSGAELVKGLRRLGYELQRQAGSHMILRCLLPRSHSVTVPKHKPVKVGTLASILHAIAIERELTTEAVIEQMKL